MTSPVQWMYRLVGLVSLAANGAALASLDHRSDPAPVAAAAVVQAGTSATALRSDDGLFHLTGRSGAQGISFVIDTGASVTVLTAADAARLGARPIVDADRTMLATAGGRTAMTWSRIPSLEIAGHRVGAIDVAVVQSGIGQSLLGQDVLSQLGTIVIASERLELRAPAR